MTREEAINFGKMWLDMNKDAKDSNTYMFIELGIKALEQQPSDDCISREGAVELIAGIDETDGNEPVFSGKQIIKMLKSLPSVTPQRPREKWIHWTDDYKDYVTCSCCKYGEEGEVLLSDKTPFCPICGADMREKEN